MRVAVRDASVSTVSTTGSSSATTISMDNNGALYWTDSSAGVIRKLAAP
jgi:streptogramin lyase